MASMIKLKDILQEQSDGDQSLYAAAVAAIHNMKGEEDLAYAFDHGKTKYGNALLFFEFGAEGKLLPKEFQLDQNDKNIIRSIGKALNAHAEYAKRMMSHPDSKLRTTNKSGERIVDLYD